MVYGIAYQGPKSEVKNLEILHLGLFFFPRLTPPGLVYGVGWFILMVCGLPKKMDDYDWNSGFDDV